MTATLLTPDLETKLIKLIRIGHTAYTATRAMGISPTTLRRWFYRREGDYGESLEEQYGDLRERVDEERESYLERFRAERERLTVAILYPPEDVAKEVRPGKVAERPSGAHDIAASGATEGS